MLDELYTAWADKAEIELQKATGADLVILGSRGRQPKMVWKTILPHAGATSMGHRADCYSWMGARL
eukprot:3234210-Heterocapsa_arctica.AAC.1